MTPNVTCIYFELSRAEGEKKIIPGKLSARQRGESLLHEGRGESCSPPQPEEQFSLSKILWLLSVWLKVI